MSLVDGSGEEIVLDIADETEEKENENINSPADLEREKQKTNEFIAQGNTGQNLFFIQNYNEYDQGIKHILNAVSSDGSRKKYDLCQADKCVEFIETYRDSEYVVVAIILCVFEFVSLVELAELRKIFIKYLPKAERADQEENKRSETGDPYLSIDTLTGVIGGKRFNTEEGQACVSLGENSKQALINVMDSFPALRDALISGLLQVYESYKSRAVFNAYQMVTAFARVSSFDIDYADRRIFPRLCADSRNTGLLGTLMYKLYGDDAAEKTVQSILLRWLRSDNKWLWRPVCMTFSYLTNEGNAVPFGTALEREIFGRIQNFNVGDLKFMASVLMQSMAFREMAARIFHNLFKEADTQEKKQFLASIYLRLLRYCYFYVNKRRKELPLVACDTGTQQKLLSPLLRQFMFRYYLRKQLYVILEAYIKEVSQYRYSTDMINHIAAYFYILAGTEKGNQQGVMDFLCHCGGTMAQQIYDRLLRKYMKETREEKHGSIPE